MRSIDTYRSAKNLAISRVKRGYGKKKFETFLKNTLSADGLIYWNEKKSQSLSVSLGLQLPNAITNLRSNNIIRQTKAFVNTSDEKILKDEEIQVSKEAGMAETKEKIAASDPTSAHGYAIQKTRCKNSETKRRPCAS